MDTDIHSDADIQSDSIIPEVRRPDAWLRRTICWIHRRRPLLTALFVVTAAVASFLIGSPPADLLSPSLSVLFVLPWFLIAVGVVVRLWGSGNLRKNAEITDSGVYRLVRHPLYLGSLSVFLAFFLTVGNPWIGLGLFTGMVLVVYYPTMLLEEQNLTSKFPEQIPSYRPPPRLLPDLRRLPECLSTDRFDHRAAYRNLGFRSVWFVFVLPVFLRLLAWVHSAA